MKRRPQGGPTWLREVHSYSAAVGTYHVNLSRAEPEITDEEQYTPPDAGRSVRLLEALARRAHEVVAQPDERRVADRRRIEQHVARVDPDRVRVREHAALDDLAELGGEGRVEVARRARPAGDRARAAVGEHGGGDLVDGGGGQ